MIYANLIAQKHQEIISLLLYIIITLLHLNTCIDYSFIMEWPCPTDLTRLPL